MVKPRSELVPEWAREVALCVTLWVGLGLNVWGDIWLVMAHLEYPPLWVVALFVVGLVTAMAFLVGACAATWEVKESWKALRG